MHLSVKISGDVERNVYYTPKELKSKPEFEESIAEKTKMIRQKSDGKNQTGQGLKILVPDQMLSRLPISLAQLKAGNNSERLKKEIRQLLYCLYQYYLKMGTIFMNTENSKTNESNKCFYEFTNKLNLKNPNKNIALANLSIYYTRKNI